MRTNARILAVISTALLLGAGLAPASALELNLGGISISGGSSGPNGTATTVRVGSQSAPVASVTLGGGSNVAAASVGSGLTARVGTDSGPLITTTSSNGNTTAAVNLGLGGLGSGVSDIVNGVTDPVGDILDTVNLPGGGGNGGGGGGNGGGGPGAGGGDGNGAGGYTPGQLASAAGGLSAGDQVLLRNRCKAVLLNPATFEPSMVELCRIIARMQMQIQ